MENILNSLSADYRKIDYDALPFKLSTRVLSPAVWLCKSKDSYLAKLGAYVSKGGSKVFVSCLSNAHNWILDGSEIKPLPYDVAIELEKTPIAKNKLSFSDLLSIYRYGLEGFVVNFEEEIFTKANNSSALLKLESPVEGLNAKLYPYQESGVAWMERALNSYSGFILADEMGLGKTIQIIALILLKGVSKASPALIVCPTTLIANWAREIESFAPSMTYLVHRGANRTGYYKDLQRAEVVITTYDTLVNDLTLFRAFKWKYFVCDEAQALKNPDSRRRFVASQVDSTYVIPVTGTPMENSLVDLWSLSDLAVPKLLKTKESFADSFPDNEEGAEKLSYLIDPLILKRKVLDVANDLPERTDIDIPIDMDPRGIEEYERIRLRAEVDYGRAGALVAVSHLSVYCAHPWLRIKKTNAQDWEEFVDLDLNSHAPLMTQKTELCVDLLKQARAHNKKILIFSIFNSCAEIILQACNEHGINFGFWSCINGSTKQEIRQQIVDDFSRYDGPAVLVLNPKAAGAGLNITSATVVIHFTQNWNPALEMQASARAHRRGQTMPVLVYRLYYKGTVEETMINRSRWKRELGELAVPLSSRDVDDINSALKISPISW